MIGEPLSAVKSHWIKTLVSESTMIVSTLVGGSGIYAATTVSVFEFVL